MNVGPNPAGAAASPEMAAPVLSVNNIEVVYDHVILVLKGVSLTVPKGGIVALLGANGAGKTTTLKAISNLLRAERGEVTKGPITFKPKAMRKAFIRSSCCAKAENSALEPRRKALSRSSLIATRR